MIVEENRFLSGPRAGAGAVAANETGTSHDVGAATGGADFAAAFGYPPPETRKHTNTIASSIYTVLSSPPKFLHDEIRLLEPLVGLHVASPAV